GVAHIVVHRLRDGDDLDAKLIKLRRIAERVVAADRNEVLDAERGEVRQHLPGEVPGFRVDTALVAWGGRKVLAGEMLGQLLHFGRFGGARMQYGPAAPVDRARVLAVEWHEVAAPAGRVVDVEVREALPAAPQPEDFDLILAAAVGHGLDHR